MLFFLDLFGVAVFAVTGSLAAGRKKLDLFGVVVLALVTALGGGTIRDMVLGIRPVFWIARPVYVIVALGASVLIFILVCFKKPPKELLLVLDAFGLAVFTAIGAQKALDLGSSYVIVIMMGMTTGVVGGMMRDILSGKVPLILRREIYATASLCGAVIFVILSVFWPNSVLNVTISIITTLVVRLVAIKWNLSLPIFPSLRSD